MLQSPKGCAIIGSHRVEVLVLLRCSGFTTLHPLRPPFLGLSPGTPPPPLSSLRHGDFRDWENEKSYAIKKVSDSEINASKCFVSAFSFLRRSCFAPPASPSAVGCIVKRLLRGQLRLFGPLRGEQTMNTKRIQWAFGCLSLVTLLAGSSGLASAVELFRFTDAFASAFFFSTDAAGCVITNVFLSAGND